MFLLQIRAVRGRLQHIWTGTVPVKNITDILIDLSCYESDDLIRHSLKLLTGIHFLDHTLFSHAAHSQLLIAKRSIDTSKELQELLPKLRHLLSIDCDTEDQWKIVDFLEKLTGYCTRTNDEEPHKENQLMLYNYGNNKNYYNLLLITVLMDVN